MTILENAISTYRAAATLLDRISTTRVDLLRSAATSMRESAILFDGFRSFGPDFDICLAPSARGTLTFRRPRSDGVELETDEPAWLTLEGWLPQAQTDASVCFVELEIDSREPLVAEAGLRVIDAAGQFDDLPLQQLKLVAGRPAIARLEMPRDEQPDSRRKVIVHLRQPPAQLSLRSFALIPL